MLKNFLIDAAILAVGTVLLCAVCLGMSWLCNTLGDMSSAALNSMLFGL